MAQIATITVETAGGPVDLPVYEPGDSGSGRLEAFRVQTASGPGFVPLAAVDEADRPYLRVQTSSGVRAVDTSASGIPDSGVAQYKLDSDSDTTTAIDSVGDFDATINGASYISDSYDGAFALSLDGSNDYAISDNSADPISNGTSEEYTVEGWYRTNNTSQGAIVFGFAGSNSDDDHIMVNTQNGNISGYLQIESTNYIIEGTSLSSTYSHVAYVVDSTDHALYVDGSQVASASHNDTPSNIGSGNFYIGSREGGDPNYFEGDVDLITHYKDRLTEQEISDRASV